MFKLHRSNPIGSLDSDLLVRRVICWKQTTASRLDVVWD